MTGFPPGWTATLAGPQGTPCVAAISSASASRSSGMPALGQ